MHQKNQKQSIIFDFGAVLIDWSPYYLYRKLLPSDDAIREFLEEIKFSEFNPKLDAGYPFSKMAEEMSRAYPQRKELVQAFFTRWVECSGDAIQGTVELLNELKRAGYPVYGLSNWSCESFAWVKDRYAFLKDLDDYLLSGMVKTTKPGEQIFRLFLERIGRPAEECVFIDDVQANVETAQRLGFTTILYRSPDLLRADLAKLEILM
jgi:2-haloacid dehalogenase